MKITVKDVLQELKENLSFFCAERHFKIIKSPELGYGYYIYKETPYGTELIKIGVAHYSTGFGLYASFMICHSNVTKILKAGRDKGEDFDLSFTYTLAHKKQSDELSGYVVDERKGVKHWVTEVLIPYFNSNAVTFFETYDDIETLDDFFNSKKNNTVNRLSSIKAQKSIIVAKLNKNPNFDELANGYYDELKKQDILYEYPDVLNYIKKNY